MGNGNDGQYSMLRIYASTEHAWQETSMTGILVVCGEGGRPGN